ncbi:unnamed protein product [Prunus brigantina]
MFHCNPLPFVPRSSIASQGRTCSHQGLNRSLDRPHHLSLQSFTHIESGMNDRNWV